MVNLMNKRKIMLLVEGAKTDVDLMKHLISIYKIDTKHEIVSYNTNIYDLYREMFVKNDPEDMDILQILKEKEKNEEKKKIFNEKYTDIILIFDLDPQDHLFTEEKIMTMMNYFIESSDMGKLYINYPMVEAFYHMKDIPDKDFNSYNVALNELKQYKQRVNQENRNRNYSKFARTREECNIVIKQNIDKALWILNRKSINNNVIIDSIDILEKQLDSLKNNNIVHVLCTCAFFIVDYNSKLIQED